MKPLRDYQRRALDSLVNGVCYLALEQGLGKTRTMIELARASGARRVLVFCPASVRLVWRDQLEQWWPDGPPTVLVDSPTSFAVDWGVFIVSYDRMSRGDEYAEAIAAEATARGPFDYAFCDEAHFLKNRTAARTRAVFDDVLPHVGRMICASGTPAPNHAGELYAPLRALAPELLRLPTGRTMTQTQFEDAYCVVENKFFNARAVRVITGSKNTTALRELMKGFLLRMTKREVTPELPPLDFCTVAIEPMTRGLLGDTLREYADIIRPDMTDEEVLTALQSNDSHIARLRTALGIAKAGAAAEYLVDFLEGSRGKITVWAEHHGVIDLLMERLGDFHPVKIDGRDNAAYRDRAVQMFLQDEGCRVFVGNIRAAGTGLTLVGPDCECSDAFFVEASYTPGENLQAAARIHRLGQKDGVLARFFTAHGTLDDRVQAIISRKTRELGELFA